MTNLKLQINSKSQGQKFPKGIEVTVVCLVVNNNGEILLSKHPSWSGGKQWVLHGGHIETGEKIFDAAVRETKEETGINVSAIKIIDCGDNIIPEKGKHFVYFVCFLKAEDGSVVPNDELTDLKWFPLSSVLNEDIESGYKKMIEKYLSEK